MKTCLSNKGIQESSDIMLLEGETLIIKPGRVAETMKEQYINVASHVCNSGSSRDFSQHEGVLAVTNMSLNLNQVASGLTEPPMLMCPRQFLILT